MFTERVERNQCRRPPPLFASRDLCAYELAPNDTAELQAFFDANPTYFEAVGGTPATPTEAAEEFACELPVGWSFTKKWLLGIVDSSNAIVGMANVVSDLMARNVWHIGLYIIATSRHGTGDARAVYDGLQTWAASNGAEWLRLGVVVDHTRAERFWERVGFVQVRTRSGIVIGNRVNTVRVMTKPLAGGSIEEYLALVTRDNPDSQNAL